MRVWRHLAEKGGHVAQAMLGVMYAKGEGVPQNYVLAHMWSNLAASKDNTEAAKHRSILASWMTPQQIGEAQKLAAEWQPKP